jgi:hypothetical protein
MPFVILNHQQYTVKYLYQYHSSLFKKYVFFILHKWLLYKVLRHCLIVIYTILGHQTFLRIEYFTVFNLKKKIQ